MPSPRLSLAFAAVLTAAVHAQGVDDASYRAATGLLHRDMPEQAAAEYRSFLKEHPRHERADSARYGLAVCLTRLGRWDEAAVELDALSGRAFEFAPDVMLLRAQCFLATGDDAGAERTLRALLKEHRTFGQADAATVMLGEALARRGEGKGAQEVLRGFDAAWPASALRPRVELLLAMLEAAEGRDAEAAERLERLGKSRGGGDARAMLLEAQCRHRLAAGGREGEGARAMALYRAAADKGGPEAPEAMLGMAQLARAAGDAAGAGRILDELAAKFAGSGVEGAARVERARAYLDEDKPERALSVLEGFLAKPDAPAEASYFAAKAEMRLGKFAAAAERLERAIAAHGDRGPLAEMMFDRAVALAKAGEAGEAAGAYRAVRMKFPRHALAAEALAAEASLALGAGDGEAAAGLSREFLAAHGRHVRAGAVQLILAEALALSGDDAGAAAQFAAFVEGHAQDPRAAEAAVRRGLALARAGQREEGARVLKAGLGAPGVIDEAVRRAGQTVLADGAIARSDWPGAEEWLRALTAKGATADAVLKLGIAVQRQGRTDESLGVFTRVIEEWGDDGAAVQARFERGQILAERGKIEEARADFEAVIGAEKNAKERRFTTHSLRHLAAIASRQNRAGEAAELLSRIAQEGGEAGIDAEYERGAALLAAGKFAEAEDAFSRFIGASKEHPRRADARAQRAIAASRQGQFERALGLMEEADGEVSSMGREVLAAFRYERAWALKAVGRVEDARRAYEVMLGSWAPASLEAHAALDLAQLVINAKEYGEAGPLLARSERAAATLGEAGVVMPGVLYLRGVAAVQQGRAAEGASVLDDLLTRYPRAEMASAARVLAGQAHIKAGRPEAAARHLEEAVRGELPAELLGPALLCLGEARAAMQQWEGSREAFERHVKECAGSEQWFQARFGIGWALEHEGRHAEAIAAYRGVVEKHTGPTAARAQFQIGECHFALKQHEVAVRELMKVDILYAYPEWSAAALFEAGRCLVELGQVAEARAQFAQVVERFKDTRWARLAAEELQRTSTGAPASLPGRADAGAR